jgi:hypothetical protein
MYGKECLAVAAEAPAGALIEIGQAAALAGVKIPRSVRTDQLGRHWVLYWPQKKYEDGPNRQPLSRNLTKTERIQEI